MSDKRNTKGTGSLRQRGNGKWQLKYVVAGKPYIRTVAATTEDKARKLLGRFTVEVDDGVVDERAKQAAALSSMPTLGDWITTYLAEYMPVGGGSTRDTYSAAFKHLTDELRATKLSDLTEAPFHSWLRDVRQTGRIDSRSGARLSVNSVRLIRAALSACLNKAVKRKLIAVNPMPKMSDLNLGTDESTRDRVKRSALSRAQITAILSNCSDPDAKLWVTIMAATALRPGEALALRWSDVDFEERKISVLHSVKRSSVWGQGVLGTTKNEASVRDVPLAASLASALKAARDEYESLLRDAPKAVTVLSNPIGPEDLIFPASMATPATRATPRPLAGFRRQFKAAVKAAGLPPTTVPHALRHSAITAMIAGTKSVPGISVTDAAKIAGHSKPSITSDVYSHAVATNLSRGAELADALIAPAQSAEIVPLARTKEHG